MFDNALSTLMLVAGLWANGMPIRAVCLHQETLERIRTQACGDTTARLLRVESSHARLVRQIYEAPFGKPEGKIECGRN